MHVRERSTAASSANCCCCKFIVAKTVVVFRGTQGSNVAIASPCLVNNLLTGRAKLIARKATSLCQDKTGRSLTREGTGVIVAMCVGTTVNRVGGSGQNEGQKDRTHHQ
jgi:hypothetical protein